MRHPELRDLFPTCVALSDAVPDDQTASLFPIEADAIRRAVPQRRHEYASARACARRAMRALDVPTAPIPTGPDRAPLWPTGLVGSLTHKPQYCAAAVARSEEVLSVGLDAEIDVSLEPALWNRILTADELAWIEQQTLEPGRLVALFLSAKETFYKCQYPIRGRFLGFHDVRVECDLTAGFFDVVPLMNLDGLPVAPPYRGGWSMTDGLILTSMTWLRREGANP